MMQNGKTVNDLSYGKLLERVFVWHDFSSEREEETRRRLSDKRYAIEVKGLLDGFKEAHRSESIASFDARANERLRKSLEGRTAALLDADVIEPLPEVESREEVRPLNYVVFQSPPEVESLETTLYLGEPIIEPVREIESQEEVIPLNFGDAFVPTQETESPEGTSQILYLKDNGGIQESIPPSGLEESVKSNSSYMGHIKVLANMAYNDSIKIGRSVGKFVYDDLSNLRDLFGGALVKSIKGVSNAYSRSKIKMSNFRVSATNNIKDVSSKVNNAEVRLPRALRKPTRMEEIGGLYQKLENPDLNDMERMRLRNQVMDIDSRRMERSLLFPEFVGRLANAAVITLALGLGAISTQNYSIEDIFPDRSSLNGIESVWNDERDLQYTMDSTLRADVDRMKKFIETDPVQLRRYQTGVRNTLRFANLVNEHRGYLEQIPSLALIAWESNGNPNLCSWTTINGRRVPLACGLTQMTAPTARRMGLRPEQRFIPRDSIREGLRYLRRQFPQNMVHAAIPLGSYNSGPHNMKRRFINKYGTDLNLTEIANIRSEAVERVRNDLNIARRDYRKMVKITVMELIPWNRINVDLENLDWGDIRGNLPRETQKYIPGVLAYAEMIKRDFADGLIRL